MTDNEIIKALECCTHKGGIINCEPCLIGKQLGYQMCEKNLMLQCRGLINRQKAEIEELRNIVKTDLLTAKEDFKLSISDITKIRAEAIKEFAERLTDKAPNITEERFHILRNEIDNLVKEMVGDDNA